MSDLEQEKIAIEEPIIDIKLQSYFIQHRHGDRERNEIMYVAAQIIVRTFTNIGGIFIDLEFFKAIVL